MTTYQLLPLNPSALISVPATGLIYAAMPSSDPINPNTVIPIDPTTSTPGTPIPVGKNPALLAATSDGAYLYVANARISLCNGSICRQIVHVVSDGTLLYTDCGEVWNLARW